MASQWVVARDKTQDGCNVWFRNAIPAERRKEIIEALELNGLSVQEIWAEMGQREGAFSRCNESDVYNYETCLAYVLAYAKPGDNLILNGKSFVFMAPDSC